MARTVPQRERRPESQWEKQWYDIDWRPVLAAGFAAGAAFLIMEMILVATIGGSTLWEPPRMIAALILGEGVLPPPATFDGSIFLTALLVHFGLSFVLAAILASFIRPLSKGTAIVAGGIFGVAVYYLNFYLVAPLAFPWFTMAQNWITLSSHIVFGLVAGWVYKKYAPPASF